jgi:hypothetical protein
MEWRKLRDATTLSRFAFELARIMIDGVPALQQEVRIPEAADALLSTVSFRRLSRDPIWKIQTGQSSYANRNATFQTWPTPPSAMRSEPVTEELWSDPRKTAAFAISTASAKRPRGIMFMYIFTTSSRPADSDCASRIGVSVTTRAERVHSDTAPLKLSGPSPRVGPISGFGGRIGRMVRNTHNVHRRTDHDD